VYSLVPVPCCLKKEDNIDVLKLLFKICNRFKRRKWMIYRATRTVRKALEMHSVFSSDQNILFYENDVSERDMVPSVNGTQNENSICLVARIEKGLELVHSIKKTKPVSERTCC
jgi:hypothetical protein